MKLRLVKNDGKLKLLCPNGSIIFAKDEDLALLLTNFKQSHTFKGTDAFWQGGHIIMDTYPGEILACVDDANRLIVYDAKVFKNIVVTSKPISVSEYADIHGKSRAIIKKLCADGRIKGAQKLSTGWIIPANAPYPEDKRHENGKHFSKNNE